MKKHTNIINEIVGQEVSTKKDYTLSFFTLALLVGSCILMAHPHIINLIEAQ